jgi:hypothetical protein
MTVTKAKSNPSGRRKDLGVWFLLVVSSRILGAFRDIIKRATRLPNMAVVIDGKEADYK